MLAMISILVLLSFLPPWCLAAIPTYVGYTTYTEPTGYLYDGGGGLDPHGNSDIWEQLLKCNSNFVAMLQIIEFDLFTMECSNDFLRIYDGPSSNSAPLFISSCATPTVSLSTPLEYFSSTNQVYIKFTSDGISGFTGAGYTIKYSCIAMTNAASITGTLSDSGGSLGYYGYNEDTFTRVTCDNGRSPIFKFTQLDIDGVMPLCLTDSISIYYGGVLKKIYCGQLSGSALPQVTLEGSSAVIHFTADSNVVKAGYTLNYECTPIISGAVYDSGGPGGSYANGESWIQRIYCDIDWGALSLELSQFSVGTSQCSKDILRIYDGPSSVSSPLLITSCSTPAVTAASPLRLMASTNEVFIQFTSSLYTNGPGYSIKYTCDPVITVASTEGTLFDQGGASTNYSNNLSVFTRISCPAGNTLTIKFTELDIASASPSSCTSDALRIYTGGAVKNTFCGTLTGSSLPQVDIGGPSALLLFTSDGSITGRGYTLSYKCSVVRAGTLYDSGGSTGNYGNDEYWQQLIQCDTSVGALLLQITQLAISTSQCPKDILRIYDGPTGASPTLFNSSPSQCSAASSNSLWLLASSTRVYILFTSDSSVTAAGYTIKYTCNAVEIVTVASGTMYDSGGVTGNYANNEISFTRISCPVGQWLDMTFTQIDIAGTSPLCAADAIKIYYGGMLKNTYCGTISGMSLPHINVVGSSAVILFTSDAALNKAGYEFNYECIPILSGIIYDSGGPSGNYANSDNWRQHIQCEASRVASLHLVQLDFGVSNLMSECHTDFLSIYDGPSSDSNALFVSAATAPNYPECKVAPCPPAYNCAASIFTPLWFFATTNEVLVEFISSPSITGPGYTIKYYCTLPAPVGNVVSDEGGSVADYSDSPVIYTPFHCPLNRKPAFIFSKLDIDCGGDGLKIYDAVRAPFYGHTLTLKSSYCGNLVGADLPQYSGSTSTVMAVFTSDGAITAAGYAFNFTCTAPIYTERNGTLYDSGGMAEGYSENEVWEQRIECPPSEFVSFTFTSFSMEVSEGCSKDYISVYDGPSPASTAIINQQCTLPRDGGFTSTSNQVFVKFMSDYAGVGEGYSLSYECQSTPVYTGSSGTLYDRGGFSGKYNNNDTYLQIIQCPQSSQRVYFHFLTLDLEYSGHCLHDAVTVFDGFTEFYPALFTGCTSPGSKRYFTSASNAVLVRMSSDAAVVGEGFSLEYICINIYSPSYGTIYDGGGTGYYNNREEVYGLLRCPLAEYVHISEVLWDIQPGDTLTIYDGSSSDQDQLLLVSDISKEGYGWSAYGSSNEVFFSFVADEINVGLGYEISFDCSQSAGVVVSGTSRGEMFDSGGANSYYSNCENRKTVVQCPDGQLVGAYFLSIVLEGSQDCVSDAVTLFDGGSVTSPILYKGCGNVPVEALYQGTTSGSKLFVTFRTDASFTQPGFRFQWRGIDESFLEPLITYVAADGADTDDCTSKSSPCKTITQITSTTKLGFRLNLVVKFVGSSRDFDDSVCGGTLSFFDSVTFVGNGARVTCIASPFIKSAGKSNTVVLEGFTLTGTSAAPLVDIRNSSVSFHNITVTDRSSGFQLYSATNATFENCHFLNIAAAEEATGSSTAFISAVFSPHPTILSELHIINCTFFNCTYSNGLIAARGISLLGDRAGGKVSLKHSTFDGSRGSGSPVLVDNLANGSVTVEGCTFKENINTMRSGRGGGLSVVGSSSSSSMTVFIIDSNFTNNRVAEGGGGAVYLSSVNTTAISSTVFAGNTVSSSGGAVLIDTVASSVTIDRSIFKDNDAADNGCGLHISSTSRMVIQESLFENNTNYMFSNALGGGIFCKEVHDIKMQSVTVIENSNGVGGGLFVMDSDSVDLAQYRCEANRAFISGGCLALVSSSGHRMTASLTSTSLVSYNNATYNGGGIFVKGKVLLRVSGSSVTGNMAREAGGGISLEGESKLTIEGGSHVTSNLASKGGAVNLAGLSTVVQIKGTGTDISSNQARFGGALYGSGYVSIGGGVSVKSNSAGPVPPLGDGGSFFMGLGAVLFFSGSSAPVVNPSIESDPCRIFHFDESAVMTANLAGVSGSLVFLERLPIKDETTEECGPSFIQYMEKVSANTPWASNRARYGLSVSSYVHSVTLEASPPGQQGTSYVPLEDQALVGIFPGVDHYFRLTPLDYFNQTIHGNYENLEVTVSDSSPPTGSTTTSSAEGGGGSDMHLIEEEGAGALVMEEGIHTLMVRAAKLQKSSATEGKVQFVITTGRGTVVEAITVKTRFLGCSEGRTPSVERQHHNISDWMLCRPAPVSVGGGKANGFLLFTGLAGAVIICGAAISLLLNRRHAEVKYQSIPAMQVRMLSLLIISTCLRMVAYGELRQCFVVYSGVMLSPCLFLGSISLQARRLKAIFTNAGEGASTHIGTKKKGGRYAIIAGLVFHIGVSVVTLWSAGLHPVNSVKESVLKYSTEFCKATSPAAAVAVFAYSSMVYAACIFSAYMDLRVLERINIPAKFIHCRRSKLLLLMASGAIMTAGTIGAVMIFFNVETLWDLSEGYKALLCVAVCLFFLLLTAVETSPVYRIMLHPLAVKVHVLTPPSVGAKSKSMAVASDPEPHETSGVSSTPGGDRTTEKDKSDTGKSSTASPTSGSVGATTTKAKSTDVYILHSDDLLRLEGNVVGAMGGRVEEGEGDWLMVLMVQHCSRYEASTQKCRVVVKKLKEDLLTLFKLEQEISILASRGIEMSTMLDVNQGGDGASADVVEVWQRMYLKYFPSRASKTPLTMKSFGGVERRRGEEMVSTILLDNATLVKHMQGMVAKGTKGRGAKG